MDTKKLHFFSTLAKTGNLRQASQLLNISHVGLSKAIHSLEDELGTPLISRDGRGLRITPKGLALLHKMNKVLESEDELLAAISGARKNPKICIGTFEVFSTYLSPHLVKILDNHADISFAELTPGNMEQDIVRGQVDYGITYVPVPHPELDHYEVAKIQMGVFASKQLLKKNLNFDELPFVIPLTKIQDSPNRVKGLDGWPDSKIERNIKYQVNLLETGLALARDGLAAGYFPQFIVDLHNHRIRPEFALLPVTIPKKIKTQQAVYAIKRKDQPENKEFKAVCRALRSLK